jgi:diguanylate cyclase (GGDEF)-like protein
MQYAILKKKNEIRLAENNLLNSANDYICDDVTIDQVTELFNRKTFVQIAEQSLNKIGNDPSKLVIALINIDDFHHITSKYDLEFQTMILQKTAEIIKKCFSSSVINARICDNEFAALFTDLDLFALSTLKIHLLDKIIKLNNVLNKPFTLTLNVAVVNIGKDDIPGISISKLISRADLLISELKRTQKSSKFLRISV